MNENRIWQLAARKMAGEASPEEIRELESLLRQNPDMHYALQNLNDLWHLPVRNTGIETDAFSRHLERMEKAGVDWNQNNQEGAAYEHSRPVSRRSRVYRISAILLSITIIFTFIYFSFYKSSPAEIAKHTNLPAEKNEVSTRNGSKSIITLPDGSKVILNSGSKLGYNKDFGNQTREVELSGEAFFDVVHNPDIPFIIHTKQVQIKVLGTEFNVKSYPGDRETETSLVRGKVEISVNNRPEQKYFLIPNQKLTVRNDEPLDSLVQKEKERKDVADIPLVSLDNLKKSKQDTSIRIETAWVDNKLVFENETFDQLASRMERWYGMEFSFRSESLFNLRFTGILEGETIEQALEALSITAGGFHFKINNNTVDIFK